MKHWAPITCGLGEDGPTYRERSCQKYRNGLTREEAERSWMVRQMWRAFPEATSENELARLVAEHLSKEGRPVEERTVRYWLRQVTTPNWRYVVPILALAGSEAVFDLIFPEEKKE